MIWRVKDGKLIEHWDELNLIPADRRGDALEKAEEL
jgi:predicted SnoaL-like aldol condensation-catalyzing enzyme